MDELSLLSYAQFDKDDTLAVEFVAAAANLRALCYGITPLSLFDAKVGRVTAVVQP